jgi:hypothetical protein
MPPIKSDGAMLGFNPKDVDMIRHAINSNHFLALAGRDAGYVFLQFFLPRRLNDTRPLRNRENDVEIDRGVGVWHLQRGYAAPNGAALFWSS